MRSMKTGMTVAALAAFFAASFTLFTVEDAGAHGTNTNNDKHHAGDACRPWARIAKADATCLYAADKGYVAAYAGHIVAAKNHCSEYGTVIAHADVENTADSHWHLDDDGLHTHNFGVWNVRSTYCCIDVSDLCWKDQVEKHTTGDLLGEVRVVKTTASGYSASYADVSTHEARWELCNGEDSQWTDTIYCDEDPEGDAHTDPATVPLADGSPRCSLDSSCNCGDHFCTADDCEAKWDESTPATYGLIDSQGRSRNHGCAPSNDADYASTFNASIDATDGTSQSCTLTVVCGTGSKRWGPDASGVYRSTTPVKVLSFTSDVDDITSHYACTGVIYRDSCSGTAVSTEVEEIEHEVPN